ncbi:uncharacterized protein KY384_009003 [Bacidia gigantensis]|uniref:uncharacterized protein n=1 Tax=Bacidia gigantensis TaxID=2732470 RepID=UPI001D0573FA|nr:uncharacterized protein KY384_009003 [Bacidia gigantensis]KAG8525359.1 hypothetical protein KY384_009003 [Bacidia gigantensis]
MASLTIALQNRTSSDTVYAYITGLAIDNANSVFLLQADARTPYFPATPSAPGASLATDCSIALGAPGNIVNATIPHIAGGRIWFSVGQPLTFLLNPGPGLVEPSVTNPSDPNINIPWSFAEFTFNSAQVFANISYVDFVSLPIAISLSSTASSNIQVVPGLPSNGLDLVCSGLSAQQAVDNAGWDTLIVKDSSGSNLRALSPNNGIVTNPNLFSNYYNFYVDAVFARYASQTLSIDTQAQWSTVSSNASSGSEVLDFGVDTSTSPPTPLTFSKPSAKDIFSCSTGSFTPSPSTEKGALIARLAAAFNRSTLLKENLTPSQQSEAFYKESVTNHYARIVHAANLDGRGYAFPFDDVIPTGAGDVSGAVMDGSPRLLTVAVGGGGGIGNMSVQERE